MEFLHVRSNRSVSKWAGIVSLVLLVAACGRSDPNASVSNGDAVVDTADIINLDQGWSKETQDRTWFSSFGSRLMPYSWFLNLEQAQTTDLFRSNTNLEALGFLAQGQSKNNPDSLPVGFSRDSDKQGNQWVGLTCAACHTGEVHYQGVKIRIDGGQSLLNFTAFEAGVIDALSATHANEEKFSRFAQRVLGDNYTPSATADLQLAVRKRTQELRLRHKMNATEVPYGYGRLDAFGQIFNAASVEFIGEPENRRVPDAPVSFPVLWSAAHLDVVQWNGSAPNFGPGPVVQNATTALAVYGQIKVVPGAGMRGYESSIDFDNLARIQENVYQLKSPQWPEHVFGAVDQISATRGEVLYQQQCNSCHQISDRNDSKRKLKASLTPLDEIGTDPTAALNFMNATSNSGFLQGDKVAVLGGDVMGEKTSTINLVAHAAIGATLRHPLKAIHAAVVDYHSVYKAQIDQHPNYYKARPLDGIWSAAPYLHNGSVPTLHDLLLPADQRPKSFYVGGRELDVDKIGIETERTEHSTLFDTSRVGNSNAGHEYGTQLSSTQRGDLLEYLKTL